MKLFYVYFLNDEKYEFKISVKAQNFTDAQKEAREKLHGFIKNSENFEIARVEEYSTHNGLFSVLKVLNDPKHFI